MLKQHHESHRRRSIRLRHYDYTQSGAYFVTICTQNRECLFGEIADGKMRLNEYGDIVQRCWDVIPQHFPNVTTDTFIVMPNHVHGIIVITDNVGATHASPLRNTLPHGPKSFSLGAIAGSFKSAVTKRINGTRGTPGIPIWQRNYYEHVIRNDTELNEIRQYIVNNPVNWLEDENYFIVPRFDGTYR